MAVRAGCAPIVKGSGALCVRSTLERAHAHTCVGHCDSGGDAFRAFSVASTTPVPEIRLKRRLLRVLSHDQLLPCPGFSTVVISAHHRRYLRHGARTASAWRPNPTAAAGADGVLPPSKKTVATFDSLTVRCICKSRTISPFREINGTISTA